MPRMRPPGRRPLRRVFTNNAAKRRALSGLTATTAPSFRLRADLNGLESYSKTAGTETQDTSATVDPSLPVPYDLTVTPDNNNDRLEYTFQWQPGSISPSVYDNNGAFQVQYQLLNPTDPHDAYQFIAQAGAGGDDGSGTVSGSAILAPLYNGIGYYEAQVRVCFIDGATVSAYSDWVTGTVSRPQLQAPENFSVADAGNGQLTATWNPVNDPNYPSSQYNIEYQMWAVDSQNSQSPVGLWYASSSPYTFTPPSGENKRGRPPILECSRSGGIAGCRELPASLLGGIIYDVLNPGVGRSKLFRTRRGLDRLGESAAVRRGRGRHPAKH
jgi:hypothetical protein